MKTAKWCLNCGKDIFRCHCRETLVAHDEAVIEEFDPKKFRPQMIHPQTFRYGKGHE